MIFSKHFRNSHIKIELPEKIFVKIFGEKCFEIIVSEEFLEKNLFFRENFEKTLFQVN